MQIKRVKVSNNVGYITKFTDPKVPPGGGRRRQSLNSSPSINTDMLRWSSALITHECVPPLLYAKRKRDEREARFIKKQNYTSLKTVSLEMVGRKIYLRNIALDADVHE